MTPMQYDLQAATLKLWLAILKQEFPWAANETLVPKQFPWLRPLSADGKHTSNIGCDFSYSCFDDRVPLKTVGVKSKEELEKKLYGDDLSFETCTVGLCLPSEFALLCQQLGIGTQPTEDALKMVQNHLKSRNRPDLKLLRSEMSSLFSLQQKSETGLSKEEHEAFCKYVFHVSIWREMVMAEMIIHEHWETLMSPHIEAKGRMEKGRQNAFYLYGLLEEKRKRCEPLVLEVQLQDGRARLCQLFRVSLPNMALQLVCLVEKWPTTERHLQQRWAERDIREYPSPEMSATLPRCDSWDVYKPQLVEIGKGVGKWHGILSLPPILSAERS